MSCVGLVKKIKRLTETITETIISSAQAGLDALSKPAISRTIFTGDSDKAGLVKIIDPYKRQFFFPIKSCRTFYVRI